MMSVALNGLVLTIHMSLYFNIVNSLKCISVDFCKVCIRRLNLSDTWFGLKILFLGSENEALIRLDFIVFYFNRNPMFVNYIGFKQREEGAFQYNVSFK